MDIQEFDQNETPYEPTSQQAQRAAELRKFNLIFVYLPIGLASAIAIVLIAILLIVALNPPSAKALLFISGLADVALVIAMLPILILGAVILGLIGYAYTQARKAGTAPIRQTQLLLWRMDNLIGRIRVRVDETGVTVRRPFLSINGAVAYVRELIIQLVRMLKRS